MEYFLFTSNVEKRVATIDLNIKCKFECQFYNTNKV